MIYICQYFLHTNYTLTKEKNGIYNNLEDSVVVECLGQSWTGGLCYMPIMQLTCVNLNLSCFFSLVKISTVFQ